MRNAVKKVTRSVIRFLVAHASRVLASASLPARTLRNDQSWSAIGRSRKDCLRATAKGRPGVALARRRRAIQPGSAIQCLLAPATQVHSVAGLNPARLARPRRHAVAQRRTNISGLFQPQEK